MRINAFGKKIFFEGVGGKDTYNITAPFEMKGMRYIAGRVEPRDTELGSQTLFFIEKDGTWVPAEDAPVFGLQDPFVAKINEEFIFGGVENFPHPKLKYPKGLGYRTVFYRGTNLRDLRKFAVGPDMMKDIRLVELEDGRIGVFTRPQGRIGGRGTIGFTILDSPDELSSADLMNAPLLKGQFMRSDWGGANEARKLPDGRIGIVGHIASRDTRGNKHYYAMAFTLQPHTGGMSPLRIIAARNNFPPGPAKKPELADVIFPGGYTTNDDGTITLYAGLSDTEAGWVVLHDPFTSM